MSAPSIVILTGAGISAESGAKELVEINRESTAISPVFTRFLTGPATERVVAWVDGMLSL